MITKHPRPVEEAMRYTFSTLDERQRRLFAASESIKLGHGGIAYIAQLLDCHRRTIERGLNELRHPDLGVTTGLTSPSLPYFAVKPFILLRDVDVPEGIPLAIEVGGS